MDWFPPDAVLRPSAPTRQSAGIAIIGCGEIVNIAHLPSYKAAGLNVVGCFDIDSAAAERTAGAFGIATVYQSLEEAVADSRVEVTDVAIHFSGRHEVLAASAKHGRHVLLQKPVASSLSEAQEYVRLLQHAGVKYQVNQQARWAGTHRLVKHLVDSGAIGRVSFIKLDITGWQDDPNTWYVKANNFTLLDHGIHYFDLIAWIAGRDALRVSAVQTSVDDQVSVSPVIYGCIFDFGDGLIASHSFNNKMEATNKWSMSFRVDGDQGSITCSFDSVSLDRKDGTIQEFLPSSKWFPDAFLGPMSDLIDAIGTDREPEASGRENLRSMRIALAALRSAERGVSVCPSDL
jgi:predicted dehydrogenase